MSERAGRRQAIGEVQVAWEKWVADRNEFAGEPLSETDARLAFLAMQIARGIKPDERTS